MSALPVVSPAVPAFWQVLLPLMLKRTLTLFILVEPFTMLPVFLNSLARVAPERRARFPFQVALAVTLVLLCAAFLGRPMLELFNVPLSAMQVSGGILMLILSTAMVLGKEVVVKGDAHGAGGAIVPLAVPLLAGPAALSYVITESDWASWLGTLLGALPILLVGLAVWLVFQAGDWIGRRIDVSSLDLIERLGGILLSQMAISLIAVGLRGLFPALGR